MPRRARLALDGVSTHLVQRGIDRSACFFCDDDRVHYRKRPACDAVKAVAFS
jgi:putative transposase